MDWQVFGQPFPSGDLKQFLAIVNYSVPLL